MKYFYFISLSLLLFVSISIAEDYIVGEGDVLKISVYDHPDLSTTVRVTGDGTIRFPLIGHIKAGGLTVTKLSEKIASLLADGYIVDPQVAVFIKEFKSKKAIIMGQVSRPGLYELRGSMSFLEILSMAGGLTVDVGEKAIIKRRENSPDKSPTRENIITIDLKRLIEKGDTSLNIQIMDGDSIYITKAGVFYVTGDVKKPDAYKYEEGTTLIKAVTMAGGFSDKASTGRVRIIRKINGEEVVFEKVKMDDPVLPGDVIIVPESFF